MVEDGDVLAYGLSVILLPQSRGFDDGVLCLGVSNGGVVSYARVGADDGWISCIALANGVHPTVY